MLQIITSAIISFIVAFLAIPMVMLIADKKRLYDIPDERKVHTRPIASLGGVAIFLAFSFSSILCIDFRNNSDFQYFLAAAFLMFFVGLKDDLVLLSAFKKLVAQIITAAIIIHLGGIKIENLFGLMGFDSISPIYGIPLTYVTIILIINAFNLIDGIDGLAGSLSLMATLLLGTYFAIAGIHEFAALSFSLSAALLAFIIFNFYPAKIFMGDSGSLLIGMICSILVLKFINVASSPTATIPIPSAIAIGISLILIPVVDTLRVFAIRIIRGRSPFSPDKNHVHHLLLEKGFSHASISLLCLSSNIVIIGFVYFFRNLGNTFLMISMFSISMIVLGILFISSHSKRKAALIRQSTPTLSIKPATKIIDFKTKEPIEKIKA
ncbi:MAG TPA: MraY family glycosyltransferase [Niabella sp.]|nr:MraY family glycosyltransferase [Niabella sp.]HOZ96811.1 MraY family glycosyltransferase [Niabella sp.]HQW14712.1 MraY family glycosyltransferase [Niabella sp.]HQX20036.1 MraY family glycosyltransferase [Niabella sp.]HQX40656.1 MraY family glycosyltransferase [Niabella sp.]